MVLVAFLDHLVIVAPMIIMFGYFVPGVVSLIEWLPLVSSAIIHFYDWFPS